MMIKLRWYESLVNDSEVIALDIGIDVKVSVSHLVTVAGESFVEMPG